MELFFLFWKLFVSQSEYVFSTVELMHIFYLSRNAILNEHFVQKEMAMVDR